MDFAKSQLSRFGWKEGEGLGPNKSGIAEALKPSLKLDKSGLGHDPGAEYMNHWWSSLYNDAANKIKNKEISDEINESKEDSEKVTKDSDNESSMYMYKHFTKPSSIIKNKTSQCIQHNEKEKKPITTESLSDDQLFSLCSGRTAHKGARHGLRLDGKLKRVMQQEMQFNKLGKSSNDLENTAIDNSTIKRKNKRKKTSDLEFKTDSIQTEKVKKSKVPTIHEMTKGNTTEKTKTSKKSHRKKKHKHCSKE